MRAARVALCCAALGFAAALTWSLRLKALALQPEWPFDLTFFHNLVWNTVHGHGYTQSASYHEPPGILAETHFEPAILLAAPAVGLASRMSGSAVAGLTALFATQAGLLALSAWAIFRLAGPRLSVAAPLTLAWLLWWPLWRIGLGDVRPLTWSVPFLALLLAAARQRRPREAAVWAALACLCREELPLMVAGICATALVWRAPRRAWLTLAGAALAAMAVLAVVRSNATFYIRPLDWLTSLGGGPSSDWGTTARELLPVRLRYLAEWALPFGAVALLAPEVLIGAIPLFGYLFTQPHEWASWEGPYVHHAAPGLAFVGGAAAVGWSRIAARLPRAAPWAAALTAVACGAQLARGWEHVVAPELAPWLERDEDVVQAHRLAAQVPPAASVMAGWSTVHLFSGRASVYAYPQEEPEDLSDDPGDGPLVPRAGLTPAWALVDTEDALWLRRTAHRLVERDRGGRWVLFGPAE